MSSEKINSQPEMEHGHACTIEAKGHTTGLSGKYCSVCETCVLGLDFEEHAASHTSI